jgi:hypothetical protein
MRSLVTRLEALESGAVPADHVDAVFIRLVRPGSHGPVYREPIAVRSRTDDWTMQRHAGEDADAFRQRAGRAAPRRGSSVPVLLEVYA